MPITSMTAGMTAVTGIAVAFTTGTDIIVADAFDWDSLPVFFIGMRAGDTLRLSNIADALVAPWQPDHIVVVVSVGDEVGGFNPVDKFTLLFLTDALATNGSYRGGSFFPLRLTGDATGWTWNVNMSGNDCVVTRAT